MTLHKSRAKARVFRHEEYNADNWVNQLRLVASRNLLMIACHVAGSGSKYVSLIEDGFDTEVLKIRIADHENTSEYHGSPDLNCFDSKPTVSDVIQATKDVRMARHAKPTAFAMFVGTTVPRLKTMLTADCFMEIVVNDDYPNTTTKFIVVTKALAAVKKHGFVGRVPVVQEVDSMEDYSGPAW